MYYVENDIEKIQTKTNLYLTSYGSEGAFHLTREVIQNSIDEIIDTDSHGKLIHITYDKKTDVMTVEDDGRGFPEQDYPMDIFCTKIQSGSKFFRTQSGGTSGEFGLGLTAVNALSEMFSLESFRAKEKYRHLIVFENGKKIEDTTETLDKKSKSHGVIVKFKPSANYLGKGTKIPIDSVVDWVGKMSYLIPTGITIIIDVYSGMKLKDSYKFKSRPFAKMLDNLSSKSITSVCSFSGDSSIDEKVKILGKNEKVSEKIIRKDIHLEVAMQYSDGEDFLVDSYCNYTNTTEGGIHVDTVEKALCRYLQEKTRETQSDAQRDKYKITWDDIRNGLCCVINLSTGAQVGFVGNAKQKVGSTELVPYLNEIAQKEITKFFSDNPAILNEYIRVIKLNAKARVEAQKIKTATQTTKTNSWDEHEIKNYIKCNNSGKKQFRELFMVEGESASGSALNGADRNTQAFLMFRGLVANPLKCNGLSEIMENKEWKTFVKILKCGIGDSFDISKLYFDRINIFTDSDADGYGISSGMLVFIYTYLRPLIEAGKVYKVFSPLYRLDDKEHPFVVNKTEMVEIFQKKVSRHFKVKLENGKQLDKNDMITFLQDTYDYSTNLIRISKNLGRVNKFLVESIIALLVLSKVIRSSTDHDDFEELFHDQKFVSNFMAHLQKKFPEVTVQTETCSIRGNVDGHFYAIKLNNRFVRQIEDLIPIYQKYGYMLQVAEKKGDYQWLTIAEFLDQTLKLSSKILTRYKGLGELNPDQMRSTALDMNNRVSIMYTVADAEKEVAIFRKLHGGGKNDMIARKNMMQEYKIARDDLDN